MISCDTCGERTHERSLVAVNGGFSCPQCAQDLEELEAKIFDMPPAAELEDVIDGAGNMSVWVAQYDSPRFQFMATGLTSYSAHCALVQGLRDHAKQYQLDDEWFYREEITVTRMTLGQTLRDREVIRV